MPDNKQNIEAPQDKDAQETKKRMEELARAIRDEMGSLTQEELERLYAAVVLMEMKQESNREELQGMLIAGEESGEPVPFDGEAFRTRVRVKRGQG